MEYSAGQGVGQRAVVLGGTGFIGRSVSVALSRLGYEVVTVARHIERAPEATKALPLDLAASSAAELVDLLRDVDANVIVNAAGGTWGRTEDELHAANLGLTEHVLAAAAQLPGRIRLVQVGSVHEYGLVPIGDSMSEELTPNPISLYGQLKVRCTEAVLAATRAGSVDGIVLRIGNVTGAGQPPASLLGGVAAQLRQAQLERRTAELELGPLGSQRDFVNRTEATAAIVAAVMVERVAEPLLNIGHGRAVSARSMVERLIEASGVPAVLREAPAEAPETQWQQMNIDRARRWLGWQPAADRGEGVGELWQATQGKSPC